MANIYGNYNLMDRDNIQEPGSDPARMRQRYPDTQHDDSRRLRLPLTMAWFELQKMDAIYDPERALKRGTLFPELDKPWLVGKGGRHHEA